MADCHPILRGRDFTPYPGYRAPLHPDVRPWSSTSSSSRPDRCLLIQASSYPPPIHFRDASSHRLRQVSAGPGLLMPWRDPSPRYVRPVCWLQRWPLLLTPHGAHAPSLCGSSGLDTHPAVPAVPSDSRPPGGARGPPTGRPRPAAVLPGTFSARTHALAVPVGVTSPVRPL